MFCRNCGKVLKDEHKFCASCGAVNKIEEIPPSLTPVVSMQAEMPKVSDTADTQEPSELNIESLPKESDAVVEDSAQVLSEESPIELLKVSEGWKKKFRLIEKAGGWNGFYCPNIIVLTPQESKVIRFNVWGFLFGSLYYLAKGMWGKGLILLAASIIIGLVFAPAAVVIWVMCAMWANGDYYRLKVLRRKL